MRYRPRHSLTYRGTSLMEKRTPSRTIMGPGAYMGTSPVRKHLALEDPAVGLCLETLGGPRGVGVLLWARNPCRPPVES